MREGCCPTSRSWRRHGTLPPAADDLSRRCRRWRGRRSAPAPIRRATTSSTSSTAIAAPTCRCCRRRASARCETFLRLGTLPDSASSRRAHQPAPLEAVLDDSRRAPHLEHDPARADHLPARPLLRRRAERDVRARSARHAGHVSAVHDASGRRALQGGRHPRARRRSTTIASTTVVTGPDNGFVDGHPPLDAPADDARSTARARARHGRRSAAAAVTLAPGQLSDWVPLPFPAAPGVTVRGHRALPGARDGRALLALHVADQPRSRTAGDADLASAATTPAISPSGIGPFATLGLAEDTWALNEGVTDDATFLQQAHDIDRRARARCSSRARPAAHAAAWCACSTPPTASSTCSGATSIRAHPAAPRPTCRRRIATPSASSIARTTPWSARCWQQLRPDDVLMVISDHGFSAFRRGVNLNAWLLREGYLTLQATAPTARPSGCATSTGRRPAPTASG